MVRTHPDHLFNQQITVVSGSSSFDAFGEEVYGTEIVASGIARFQTNTVRVLGAGGNMITTSETKVWTKPSTPGSVGHYVELSDGRKYRINVVEPKIDGKGGTRVQTWVLGEVVE